MDAQVDAQEVDAQVRCMQSRNLIMAHHTKRNQAMPHEHGIPHETPHEHGMPHETARDARALERARLSQYRKQAH